jgi:hypothetical protein
LCGGQARDRCGVETVLTFDGLQNLGRVGHSPRAHSGAVERRRVGNQPVARHTPIGRFQTHDATIRGGEANGASRVRTNAPEVYKMTWEKKKKEETDKREELFSNVVESKIEEDIRGVWDWYPKQLYDATAEAAPPELPPADTAVPLSADHGLRVAP